MGRVGAKLLLACLCVTCGGGGGEAVVVGGGAGPAPAPPEPLAGPPGARSFKSGPIQVTADGAEVWTANRDHDSVSRIRAADDTVAEFALPAGARHAPHTLSLAKDGAEAWVACHDSDRVYVLSGRDGSVLARIDLPWGSGPCGIALSRDGATALVTLLRRGAVAEIDVAARTVARILEPTWKTPLGVAWSEDGDTAWVTHLLVEGGEHPRVTRLVRSQGRMVVAGDIRAGATDPRQSSDLAPPHDIAEGGYLTFRGHLAQLPGGGEIWLPTQYNNIHEDRFSPDSTIQATIRRLRTADLSLQNTTEGKVILSAVFAHEPAGNNAFAGPGWNARVAGPIDIAFSADASLAYVVCEQSNDLVILPTDAGNVRPAGAPALTEVRVGDRPTGVAVSPVEGAAYVYNQLSRDVSVIDVAEGRELRRVPVSDREPFDPQFLRGAKLFHTSADPRLSSNEKVACASCHVDAEVDGRSWAFHRLEGRAGPRPTLTMRGLGRHFGPPDPATGFGQLHRSGDRDEVQDFEHTIRGELMRGTGLIAGAPNPPLGAPNAGRSADLDALAHYVLNLPPVMRSPHRAPDGSLTERAVRGARLFLQAGCADCHVPETGFVDFSFHDVGSRRPQGEEELNHGSRAPFQWHVATKTLVGLFATPGYEGVATFAETVPGFLADIADRTSHGDIRGLSGQERADLAALLLSIDGDMTADEVRNARDTVAPRVARVAPASLDRLDVWFSEPVDEASAETVGNYALRVEGGGAVPVTAAVWSARNGDRVTLFATLARDTAYVLDVERVADGSGNRIGTESRGFALSDTLTVTLGASGNESWTIAVHDAGTVGPGLSTWSHDAPWLFGQGDGANKGFVRFEWRDALVAAGADDAGDILAASFKATPEFGHRHAVEIRRCLQAWSDPPTGGDWNRNANGGPTWRDHSHPNARWNRAGANGRAAGVQGDVASDYDGPNDTAFTPDATAVVESVAEPVEFAGAAVTDAFRFWFDHPGLDYGYVLQFAPGAPEVGLKLWRHEHGLGEHGPVLTITFRLP